MVCEINKDLLSLAITAKIKKQLMDSGLFQSVSENQVTGTSPNSGDIISQINKEYDEEIIKGGIIKPSDKLINEMFGQYMALKVPPTSTNPGEAPLTNNTPQNSIYNILYDYLNKDVEDPVLGTVNSNLQSLVNQTFEELPKVTQQIISSIKNEQDRDDKEALLRYLNIVKNSKIDRDRIVSQLQLIVNTSRFLIDLENQSIEAVKEADPNIRILNLYSIKKTVDSYGNFANLLGELYNTFTAEVGRPKNLKIFYDQIYAAIAVPKNINKRIEESRAEALKSIITDYNSPIVAGQLKEIDDRIQYFRDKLKTTTNVKRINLYQNNIKTLQQQRKDRVASPEAIQAIFEGNFRDANAISMYLESLIANGHPVVATVASILKDLDIEINQDMLSSVNEMQKENDALNNAIKKGKGLNTPNRDLQLKYGPIMTTVQRATRIEEKENSDGTISYEVKYNNQKMLLSPYSPEYLQKFEEWDVFEKFWEYKIYTLKQDKNIDHSGEIEAFEKKIEDLHTERADFKRENSEGKYLPEVYEMWALLEKPLTLPDGTISTINKIKGDLSNKLHIEQELLEQTQDPELRNIHSNTIDDIVREMRELRNPYDKLGQLKTGVEAEISTTLQDFYTRQRLYGDFNITDRQRGLFEADLQVLNRKYRAKEITLEEYNRQNSLMTRDEIDPKFFELQEAYSDQINAYAEELLKIPELRGKIKAKSTDYKKLRQVTAPFRDEDGKIDGINFETGREEVRKEIRLIQESNEKLKSETEKLKGLSIADSIRLKELDLMQSNPELFTDERRIELEALEQKKLEAKALYNQHKTLIDAYQAAILELAQLTDSTPTHYYYEQQANIINNLKSTQPVIDKVEATMKVGKFSIKENGTDTTYELLEGKWLKNGSDVSDIQSEEAVNALLSQAFAHQALYTSDWWRENHFEVHEWNGYGYSTVQKPIYIWMIQSPKDEKWIKRNQPSFRYKKFEIKEAYHNPNFHNISRYIPAPKPGKFQDVEYTRLKNSNDELDKAYFRFLNYAEKKYNQTQSFLPQHERLGNILPSIIKSTGENSVEFTNNIKENFSNLLRVNFTAQGDEDAAYLMGGSIKAKKEKKIPIRFTSSIDGSNQSSNIAGMLLMFELSTKKFEKLQEVEPFFKSLQETLRILPVKDSRTKGLRLSLRNVGKALRGKTETELVDKPVDTSNLYETVTNALNMFVYGEMSKNSTMNIMGFQVDFNRATSSLMNFVSKSTFIGAVASPIKNTLSTGVQSIINSNVQQGFYSNSDLAKAQGQTMQHLKDFFQDFQKAGNRSFMGQMFQHFLVLPESLYDEYGKKTQFTYSKEKFSLLTGFKNFSEFEATIKQFLAYAYALKVKLGDKDIPLSEAYELKDGTLKLKDGIIFPDNMDQKTFENQFIKKLHYINRNIAGAYREDERNYAETFTLGKLGMFMNRYYPSLGANRWSGTRYSIETGNMNTGFYRDGYKFFKEAIVDYQFNLKDKWADMSPKERANALKFIKELSFIAILTASIALLGGGDDKKELRKNTPLYNFMVGTLIGVNNETQTFVDYHDVVRKMGAPFMAINQLKLIVNTLDLVAETAVNSDDAYFKRSGIKDGLHDKGDSKLLASFLKLMGYSPKVFHPEELISTQRSLTQLR